MCKANYLVATYVFSHVVIILNPASKHMVKVNDRNIRRTVLNPIQDGHFWDDHLKSIKHILQ